MFTFPIKYKSNKKQDNVLLKHAYKLNSCFCQTVSLLPTPKWTRLIKRPQNRISSFQLIVHLLKIQHTGWRYFEFKNLIQSWYWVYKTVCNSKIIWKCCYILVNKINFWVFKHAYKDCIYKIVMIPKIWNFHRYYSTVFFI